MEILNEFDEYVAALKKVDINEEVMPYVRGKLLTENVELYAKIQKLLGCIAFEPCHRFLYDLDIENIDESEASKVNNLYQLGLERGFIVDEKPEDEEDKEPVKAEDTAKLIQKSNVSPKPAFVQAPAQSAFTVLYSAMRDGQIKTGEAFSNAINTRSAKADVISKLERAGYSNITILAIEAGDPDMQGCSGAFYKQANEADCREPLAHAFDPYGIKAATANSAAQDAVAMTIVEKDKGEDKEASEKSKEGSDSSTSSGSTVDTAADAEDNENAETATVDTAADAEAAENSSEEDDSSDEDAEDNENAEDDNAEEDDSSADKDKEKAEDNKEDDSSDEDSKKDSKDTSDEKELSASEKSTLKDAYKKAFKAAMLKLKFEDKCFDDLTLDQKVDFFTEISDSWKDKADPKEFMTPKEVEALEKIVIKQ